MKNNLFLKIGIGVLLVLVTGLTVKFAITYSNKPTGTTEVTTTINVPPTVALTHTIVTLVLPKTIEECDKIKEQVSKDDCYEGIAVVKQDSSICDKIQNQIYKDNCYGRVAATEKDLSICDKIQNQITKDFCYEGVAQAKQDSSICDKIQNQIYKDSCYNFIKK